jgi:hypothetical protein
MFHPSTHIQESAEAALRKARTIGKGILVGMHLRLKRPIPNGSGASPAPPPQVFFRTALLAALRHGLDTRLTTFYLATDDSSAQQDAKVYFASNNLTFAMLTDISFGSDGDRSSKRALKNAIVDMFVISQCQVIVGTYGSSFSSVAASIAGVTRYEVKADGSYWQALPEPCYRFSARGHSSRQFILRPQSIYHEQCMLGHVGKVAKGKRGNS